MEIINNLRQLLADMSEEVRQLAEAYMELNNHIAREAEYIDKLDRIAEIKALKERLAGEVYRIQQEESSSEHTFNSGRLYSGIMDFAAGAIAGSIFKQESPLLKGYELSSKELAKKAHFGMVMIAIKKCGSWKDTKVMAISRLAREAGTTEADIISSMRRRGYHLYTPEDFWQILERLKAEVSENKLKNRQGRRRLK